MTHFTNRPPAGWDANPDLNALAIHALFDGRTDANGSFTCTLSQTTTTVSNRIVNVDDIIFLVPLDANAASEVATTYVARVTQGDADANQFTVTHASNGTTRTFGYHILGN